MNYLEVKFSISLCIKELGANESDCILSKHQLCSDKKHFRIFKSTTCNNNNYCSFYFNNYSSGPSASRFVHFVILTSM